MACDLAFSPDGGLLACAHSNGDVHVWDAGTGRHVRQLRGLQESMSAVAFLDDHRLAAAGRDADSGPPCLCVVAEPLTCSGRRWSPSNPRVGAMRTRTGG